MHRLFIDTCVWLDMAKDYRSAQLVYALRELADAEEVQFIVPDIVLDEFVRNKERAVEESHRSLMSHLRAVKQAVHQFTVDDSHDDALRSIENVNLQVGKKGDTLKAMVESVGALLEHPTAIKLATTVFQKARAADRALYKTAPCHREKNSIADAVLLEAYIDYVKECEDTSIKYAFVSANIKDFSDTTKDNRNPHPHIAGEFDGDRSSYVVNLAEFVETIDPDLLGEYDFQYGLTPTFRTLTELVDEEHLLFRKVWYNRHQNLKYKIEIGEELLVPSEKMSKNTYKQNETSEAVWAQALAAAERTEEEVGIENLGPWDDFEWGMLNGKLSAIRWMLGDDWDMLDT